MGKSAFATGENLHETILSSVLERSRSFRSGAWKPDTPFGDPMVKWDHHYPLTLLTERVSRDAFVLDVKRDQAVRQSRFGSSKFPREHVQGAQSIKTPMDRPITARIVAACSWLSPISVQY